MRAADLFDGADIQMVIVIMTDEYDIDGRQIIKAQARLPHAFWAHPAVGTGAVAPHGIGKNMAAVNRN
jgi:hypothetical protein